MTLSASRKGDIAELFVAQYFMKEGFDVFRNLGCDGPIDLIIHNRATNVTLKIDVKSQFKMTYNADGSERFNSSTIGLRDDGVWNVLYVHGEPSPRLCAGFCEALGMDVS